jgi:hypothetical protein
MSVVVLRQDFEYPAFVYPEPTAPALLAASLLSSHSSELPDRLHPTLISDYHHRDTEDSQTCHLA